MSDEQRGGMEPEAGTRRTFTEDEPAEDTVGHGVEDRPAKGDEQPGKEDTEASDNEDTEGHRASLYSDRNLKRDITPVSW